MLADCSRAVPAGRVLIKDVMRVWNAANWLAPHHVTDGRGSDSAADTSPFHDEPMMISLWSEMGKSKVSYEVKVKESNLGRTKIASILFGFPKRPTRVAMSRSDASGVKKSSGSMRDPSCNQVCHGREGCDDQMGALNKVSHEHVWWGV